MTAMNNKQQKLREWILKQDYLFLNPKYDGMNAWEIAGKILKEIEDDSSVQELNISEMIGEPVKITE